MGEEKFQLGPAIELPTHSDSYAALAVHASAPMQHPMRACSSHRQKLCTPPSITGSNSRCLSYVAAHHCK